MFENIITLAAEGEQTTLKEFSAKHPELKRFYDLGEKAAALEPKLQTLKYKGVDQIDQAITELEQHRAWKEKDWPTWNTIHTNLETAFANAQSKIAELEARTETEMTPEEIRQVVKEALAEGGVIGKPDIEKLLTDKLSGVATKDELGGWANGVANRFEDVYDKLTPAIMEHSKNFDGEILKPKQVFDAMREMAKARNVHIEKIDPLEAYQSIVAPRLAEKQKADTVAQIAAAKQDGIKEGQKLAREAAGSGQRGVPVDGKGSTSRLGPLQRKAMEKYKSDTEGQTKAPLGKGIIAAQQAAAHREKLDAGAV